MVAKKTSWFYVIMICADVAFLLSTLLAHRNSVLYPNFTFNWRSMLMDVVFLAIINAVLGFIFFLCRKTNLIIKLLIMLPFIIAACPIAMVYWYILTPGEYWTSETDDFSEFTRVDESLDNNLKIAGLRISDLIEFEINSVDDFHYFNRSSMMTETFVFKCVFNFERDSYEKIKNAFENSVEWDKYIYTPEEQLNTGVNGKYVLDYEVPNWESNTSPVEWETVLVVFSDEQCRIEFDLCGWIDAS